MSYEKYNAFLDKTDYTGVDRKLIQDFLKLGSAGEEGMFIDEYLAAVGREQLPLPFCCSQYMTTIFFSACRNF